MLGIFEPESRLYLVAIPLVITTAGCLVFGYGVQNSDVLLLVNGLKNIVAFGFLYGVVPWVEEAGYVNAFGTMAGVFAGIVGIGAVLLVIYGATVRHTSAQWKVILE